MYWTHYSHPISLRYLILQYLLSSCVDTVLFYEQNAVIVVIIYLDSSTDEKKRTPTQQVYHTAIEQHHSGRGD